MALDSKHPLYSEFLEDWNVMEDTYRGERVIKSKGSKYLPPTSGMIADGFPTVDTPGWKAYNAYKTRAIFHGFVDEAVKTLVGIMHHKPATFELPKIMEPMIEEATTKGESLQMLLRKINVAQLVQGRFGMLLDLPTTPTLEQVLPYIATYKAKTIINWDDGNRDQITRQNLNLVVLDETEDERNSEFEWTREEKYRVLILGDAKANEGSQGATYKAGVFKNKDAKNFNEDEMLEPSFRGNKLKEIPFVFVNASDIVPEPDDPPLIGLAKLALAIYRGEADYRQSLFMQGQDTLVVIGDHKDEDGNDKTYRTGANASISLPKDGDAKFIGVDSAGLSEQKDAIQADKKDAATLAGQLMDNTARGIESGDALQMRVSARTATLNEVALTSAFALQSLLRICARWLGANPEEVVVTPNLDFADERLEGKTLVEYMSAKMLGAPISLQSIHSLMQDRGLTEFEFEEELALIADEEPLVEPPSDESSPDEDENNSES